MSLKWGISNILLIAETIKPQQKVEALLFYMVPEDGLEPSLLSETDFESVASTNFTTRAEWQRLYLCIVYKQVFLLTNRTSD